MGAGVSAAKIGASKVNNAVKKTARRVQRKAVNAAASLGIKLPIKLPEEGRPVTTCGGWVEMGILLGADLSSDACRGNRPNLEPMSKPKPKVEPNPQTQTPNPNPKP